MANVQILKQKFQCPCDVIPVLDTGIQLLCCIVHNQIFWIPVSGHWDDTHLFL
ncbi:MAG: hypothetical protein O7157_01620 [Wolbachia endosymbiont of Tetragnatha montana]|nr:hypothetical protein [Wolbachia endosymbiont of Tetragnatha montana]